MINNKLTILLTFLILQFISINCTLRLVIQQYRHGARGTYNGEYLGNISEEEKYMEGQLTPVGQRQHYVLGKHLREEYGHFLDDTFTQDQMYVRSLNINRTLQSAQAQLYGIYPNGHGQVLPENLDLDYTLPPFKGAQVVKDIGDFALPKGKQNIQIHSMLKDFDPLLSPNSAIVCPNYQKLSEEFQLSERYLKFEMDLQKQMKTPSSQISRLLGQTISLSNYQGLWDNIMCNMNAGLDVPSEIQPGEKLYNDINYVSNLYSFKYMEDQTLRKLANFNLVNQYLNYLDSAYNGNKSFKWYMVSASDTNLQYIMPMLNITSVECFMEQYTKGTYSQLNCEQKPRFTTSMMIEMHENDDQQDTIDDSFYVMIKFNGAYLNICEKESHYCSYTEFKQRILNSMMSQEEYDEACGLNQKSSLFKSFFNNVRSYFSFFE